MLKLSTKRTHNLIDAPPPCTPHRIRFLDINSPVKRVRPFQEDVSTSGRSSMETVAAADAPSPPASPPSTSGSSTSTSSSGTPFSFTFPPTPSPSTSTSSSPSTSTSRASRPFTFDFPTSASTSIASSSTAPVATPFTFAFPNTSSSNTPSTSGSTSQPAPALSGKKHYRGEPRFVPKNRFDPNEIARFVPRKKLRKFGDSDKGPLFTLEEVKALVVQVVAQREATLREEFERTLEDTLQDQFAQFSQFNRDYIDRQISSSEYSYLS